MACGPFVLFDTHAKHAGRLICLDLAGPMQIEGTGHKWNIVTYLNDKSGYSWVFALHDKSQQFQTFKMFHQLLTTETICLWKCFQMDCGGEYIGNTHTAYYQEHGIIHKMTMPHTPQQNSDSEGLNKTLVDKVWAILQLSRLPKTFWPDIFKWANYVWNQSPTTCLIDMTPYKAVFGIKPDLTMCCELGEAVLFRIPDQEHGKCDAQAIPCRFLRVNDALKA